MSLQDLLNEMSTQPEITPMMSTEQLRQMAAKPATELSQLLAIQRHAGGCPIGKVVRRWGLLICFFVGAVGAANWMTMNAKKVDVEKLTADVVERILAKQERAQRARLAWTPASSSSCILGDARAETQSAQR